MGTKVLLPLFLIWATITCIRCSLPSEYSIIGTDFEQVLSEERAVELFQRWMAKHRKVYRNPGEAEMRLENFRRNLKYVIQKNSRRKSAGGHSVGLNRFADMGNEEFREVYLSKVKKPASKRWDGRRRNSPLHGVKSCEAPSSLDWRNYGVVTGVKDQGSCGMALDPSQDFIERRINEMLHEVLKRYCKSLLIDECTQGAKKYKKVHFGRSFFKSQLKMLSCLSYYSME